MGCDIHCHVEVKFHDKWHHYTFLKIPRYYALFARMANVRNYDNEVSPIDQPRGLPTDITDMTRLVYKRWGSDAHSQSYLNSAEVIQLYDWIDQTESFVDGNAIKNSFGYLFGHYYKSFYMYRYEFPEELQDFRWVFWFDN